MTENKAQESVLKLTRAGFNVSRDTYEYLLRANDPERITDAILEGIRSMEHKPTSISPEFVESVIIKQRFPILQGEDWDFRKADTQYMVHGLHPYPARMIPQIARRLLKRYSQDGNLILDPFCGSGTVLTECRLMKRNCIGIDINPLAVLLAKVKSTPIDSHNLKKRLVQLIAKVEKDKDSTKTEKNTVLDFKDTNIEYWFKDYVINELRAILQSVQEIDDIDARDFLKVCFSLTAFKVSNSARSIQDPFIKSLPKDKLGKYSPNVRSTFKDIVLTAKKQMSQFSEVCKDSKSNWAQAILGDAKELPLADEIFDLIVTSPPYGEEKNTASYMRWAKLVLFWFGYTPTIVRRLTKGTLGSKATSVKEVPSETLDKLLFEIAKKNPRRAEDVASFCLDYFKSLEEMYRVLKRDCYCCIVVGNRSAAGIRVPMNAVTKEFGEDIGFKYVKTHIRRISQKVQPHVDYKVEMINHENVIILKK